MRNRAFRRIPQVLALLAAGSLATAMTAAARPIDAAAPLAAAAPNDPAINLCATTGTATLPGGASVPIWSFADKLAAADCSDVATHATLTAPPLTITQGDVVTINVTNALPAGHAISIEAPGIAFDPGQTDAGVGQTVSRTFTASAPGTYLLQSVGDGERQTAMGLYRALIVKPAGGSAYGTAASAYDVEAPLVLGDIDPAFNADPDGFDMHAYRAAYWLINGRAYPDTPPIIAAGDQKVLLRYVNAGHDNTTMALLGTHERVIARDANPLPNLFDADAETIPAGETEDAIVTMPAATSALPHGLPLYNRQLHLGNGAPADPTALGGMVTFIKPSP
jgi:FtsP/CotA-like multicopper oxidase with cupredoxin domain